MADPNASEVKRIAAPYRRHTLMLQIGADSLDDLAAELRMFAHRAERDELGTGCIGGPSCGSTYSYVFDPDMTHERYFAEIDTYLQGTSDEK